jgi:peptidoglycan/LPS O-acetylase OafA/YrhL
MLGIVWLLGYAAYCVERYFAELPRSIRTGYAIVTAVLFCLVLILSKTIKLDDVLQDVITGVAFAVLVVPLCTLDASEFVTRPAKLFAGFSYTLYVAHFPFLAFLTSALLHNARVAPSGRGLVTFAALFAVTMGYAYLVSLAFERNTPALQTWLLRNVTSLQLVGRSAKIALRTE